MCEGGCWVGECGWGCGWCVADMGEGDAVSDDNEYNDNDEYVDYDD